MVKEAPEPGWSTADNGGVWRKIGERGAPIVQGGMHTPGERVRCYEYRGKLRKPYSSLWRERSLALWNRQSLWSMRGPGESVSHPATAVLRVKDAWARVLTQEIQCSPPS